MDRVKEVTDLLLQWEEADSNGREVTPTLESLAEIFEAETADFLSHIPDPFDDRHPSRLQPECILGQMLKTILRNQRIMDEMIKVYPQQDRIELNTVVCRLLLNVLPGLESIIFNEESFILKLYHWVENAPNPLQAYATGILAAAMERNDVAGTYQEKNAYFVPLLLKRLNRLCREYIASPESKTTLALRRGKRKRDSVCSDTKEKLKKTDEILQALSVESSLTSVESSLAPVESTLASVDSSTSEEPMYVVPTHQVYPLTLAGEQKFILQYLTRMGEYLEFIGPVIEEKVLNLICCYINCKVNVDAQLALEALKYLSAIICHKKIMVEFLSCGGIRRLLQVPIYTVAAAGVAICFYYLTYQSEALEKISMLNSSAKSEIISYLLSLLVTPHDSNRGHAILSFNFCFHYRGLLEIFDHQDGLRKLFNQLSTLDIYLSSDLRELSDDKIFSNRLNAKHICLALKSYFESHLANFVDDIITSGGEPTTDSRASKPSNVTNEAVERNMEILHELYKTPLPDWTPVIEFMKLDGIKFLLELISKNLNPDYSGGAETLKWALDILKICALTAPAALQFCERISNPFSLNYTGISVILQSVKSGKIPYAEAQHSALQTIINLVCPKISPIESRFQSPPNIQEILNKVWEGVRSKNGIMVLLDLLHITSPPNEADSIRALACKALCGLARYQRVKQIISKVCLITDGLLMDLMNKPVLETKITDYNLFCKYGNELMQEVTDAPLGSGLELLSSVNKLLASEVVARTDITYPEHQLLRLIADHLSKLNYTRTVACLQAEMQEKSVATRPLDHILAALPGTSNGPMSVTSFAPTDPPPIPVSTVPVKRVKSKTMLLNTEVKYSPPCRMQKPIICSGSFSQAPGLSAHNSTTSETSLPPSVSLDSIITEYLRKQHLLCKTPMLCCPPFDLFKPHKCPEPQSKESTSANLPRLLQREHGDSFKRLGYGGNTFNRKDIFSRFHYLRSIRDEEVNWNDFSSCEFYRKGFEMSPRIILGTNDGYIKVYNIDSGNLLASKFSRGITYIESNRATDMFITCDESSSGCTCTWRFLNDSNITLVALFDDVTHMQFGKTSFERAVASKYTAREAAIYDTSTNAEIQTFSIEELGHNYIRNQSTFNYTDKLVLSDGLLFDVDSGMIVHKLDKMNSNLNGIFHPNGREIISNTEIWDMRTFHLLRTVPSLDQSFVSFNTLGDVIYAVGYDSETMVGGRSNCFQTFDAHDYSIIATVDVSKPVFDLATDGYDRYVATIERAYPDNLEFMKDRCKIYQIGRTRQPSEDTDDEDSDESDDEEGGNDDSDDDEVEGAEEAEGEDNADDNEAWLSSSDDSSISL